MGATDYLLSGDHKYVALESNFTKVSDLMGRMQKRGPTTIFHQHDNAFFLIWTKYIFGKEKKIVSEQTILKQQTWLGH